MRTVRTLILFLFISTIASAQTPVADLTHSFTSRVAAAVNKSFKNGFQVSLNEQMRLSFPGEPAVNIDMVFTTLTLNYSINSHWRASTDCAYIYKKNDIRYRGGAALSYIYRTGDWTLTLRERAMVSHFTREMNTWAQARNPIEMRTNFRVLKRVKSLPFDPYAAVEIGGPLNSVRYRGTDPSGMSYTYAYLNRGRVQLGSTWRLDPSNVIDLSFSCDYTRTRSLSCSADGYLLGMTIKPSVLTSLALAYRFSL